MEKSILKNGITLLTKHIANSHAASIGIWIKTGSIHEDTDEIGYAHLLEHMMFKGTHRRTSKKIAEEIDSAGAYINAATSKEYTTYFINIIDEKIELGLDILIDILDNSTFKAENLKKEKQVILEEIKMYEDTPSELVQDNLTEAMMHGHPIGNSILGEKKIIKNATQKKLINFYKKNYFAKKIIITAAGNVKHNIFKDYVLKSKFFNTKIKNNKKNKNFDFKIKPRNIILSKSLSQIHLCLGFPSVPIVHKLRHAIYILNASLGSSMSSRLFQKIRENLGLCYSIYSYTSLYKDNGFFSIYIGTSMNYFEKALSLIMKEIKKIKKEILTDQEITNAKEHLKGNMALAYENIDTHMNSLARQEIYFQRYFTFNEMIKKIEKVSKADIEKAINIIFPDDYNIIVSSIGMKKYKKIINDFNLTI